MLYVVGLLLYKRKDRKNKEMLQFNFNAIDNKPHITDISELVFNLDAVFLGEFSKNPVRDVD